MLGEDVTCVFAHDGTSRCWKRDDDGSALVVRLPSHDREPSLACVINDQGWRVLVQEGTELGRYRIVAPIGAGGMGEVYRARDSMLRRDVALKVLNAGRLEGTNRETFAARMINEARAAAALTHPNVVTIYDVGEAEGLPYIVFELVQGSTLRVLAKDPSITLLTRLRWLRELAIGLAAAHNAGFVHRDVKPANVMVTNQGQVKLLDFGVAKRSPYVGDTVGRATLDGPASFKTQTGSVVGTPRYMAPETMAGLVVDARADQYAWGAIAYELLSMSTPETLGAGRLPLAALAPSLPPEVVSTVERALSQFRDERFPNMDLIVLAMAPFGMGPASSSPRTQVEEHWHSPLPSAPTAPPPVFSAPTAASALPHPVVSVQQLQPTLPAKSSVVPFVIGVGVALGAVALLGVGVLVGSRAMESRSTAGAAPSTSSRGSAPPATTGDASAVAGGAIVVASGTAKGPRTSAPSLVSTAPKPAVSASATVSTGELSCRCFPSNGPDAQVLCKRVASVVECRCDGNFVICAVPPVNGQCPSSFSFHGALRTGDPCNGFTSRGDPGSGKLMCRMCANESGPGAETNRNFTGQAGDACRGFHVSSGAPLEGRLTQCLPPR